jgi:hypothetical protein
MFTPGCKVDIASPDEGSNKSEIIDNTLWTLKHEDIMRQWKAKCFVNLWLQDRSAIFYSKIYNWLSFPIMLISSASSAALFASHNLALRKTVGVLTLVAGVLTALTRQFQPGELHQQHATITRRYHNLIRHIDTCLSITPSMRPGPELFLERIGIEIDNLAEAQLDPPMSIVWSFEKKFGPVDRLLYGEDILVLMKMKLETNRIFKNMTKATQSPKSDKTSLDPISLREAVSGDVALDMNIVKNMWMHSATDRTSPDFDIHKHPSFRSVLSRTTSDLPRQYEYRRSNEMALPLQKVIEEGNSTGRLPEIHMILSAPQLSMQRVSDATSDEKINDV